MGIWHLSKGLFRKAAAKGAVFSAIGGFAVGKILERNRKRWERARAWDQKELLKQISPYQMGCGAGKVLAGWLTETLPAHHVQAVEQQLQLLLRRMDRGDALPEEKARSRFIVSKVLFQVEGFHLRHCRYEDYQQDALRVLRKNPKYRRLSRNDVFRGQPFNPEDILATTHRMLLMLDNGHLARHIQQVLHCCPLRSDIDYMAYLIAATLAADDTELQDAINLWFQDYCDFKIGQTHRQEAFINTSITTVTGGLPVSIGMDLLNRAIQSVGIRK